MTIIVKSLPTDNFFDAPLPLESYISGRLADPFLASRRNSKNGSHCLIVLTVHYGTETAPPVFYGRNNCSTKKDGTVSNMVTNISTGNEQKP